MIYRSVVSLCCNMFFLFLILQFLSCFCDKKKISVAWKIISCAAWYVGVFICSEFVHIPLLNFAINTLFVFLISMCYEGAFLYKLLVTLLITALSAACDFAAYSLLILQLGISDSYYISYIFTILLFGLIERGVGLFARSKRQYQPDQNEIHLLFVIPVLGLIILYCVTAGGMDGVYLPIAGLGILGICIMSFYIQYVVLENMSERWKRVALEKQVDIYQHELSVINESQQRLEGLRHDLRHHLIELEGLAEGKKNEELLAYIREMTADLSDQEIMVRSGNYEIDGLVNYLLYNAREKLNYVDVKVNIPENMKADYYKLNIILGNLMENAIEAAMMSDQKQLKFVMTAERGMLFISVENSYEGTIEIRDGRIESSKRDGRKHGLGIGNVQRIVEEQNGEMKILAKEGIFTVHVAVYLDKN